MTHPSFAATATYRLPTPPVTPDNMIGFAAIVGVGCCGLFTILSVVAIAILIARKRRGIKGKGSLVLN